EHRFVVAEQLQAIDIDDPRIVLEPVGRYTAPAVAVAASITAADDPDSPILVMPSDHVITDPDGFRAAVETALLAASDGTMVLFGIRPSRPETGFGYIAPGATLTPDRPVLKVEAFVEKPDAETAERY